MTTQSPTFRNPFQLDIKPEPDNSLPSNSPWHAILTVPPGGIIPGHFHKPECEGEFDPLNNETYQWVDGSPLYMFRRPPKSDKWEPVVLNENNHTVTMLTLWPHAGVNVRDVPSVMRVFSRVSHFRHNAEGGNVHRLRDKEQPPEILFFLRRLLQHSKA